MSIAYLTLFNVSTVIFDIINKKNCSLFFGGKFNNPKGNIKIFAKLVALICLFSFDLF